MSAVMKAAAPASATRTLCEFLSGIRYEDVPQAVVLRSSG